MGGGNQGKCVNETAYHHVTTEAAGFPHVSMCVPGCVRECEKCACVHVFL